MARRPILKLYEGKDVMVFDNQLWTANGGDSKTDSFMRKAKILKLYSHDDDKYGNVQFGDVQFEHDGRESKGHYSHLFEEVPE